MAERGLGSRRACEKLIQEGKVKVNGRTAKLGDKAELDKDRITLDGKIIEAKEKKVYLILNKPWGWVTTVSEPFGMKTVMNLIKVKERVFPVGRLDRYSDGLLLLTNDGELAHKLTHPSFGVSKTYLVKLERPIIEEDLVKLQGIKIDGRKVELEELVLLAPNRLKVKIHEGRKHIIRRVFEKLGYRVTKLTRLQFGPLILGNLKVGQGRFLTAEEIESLKKEGKKV